MRSQDIYQLLTELGSELEHLGLDDTLEIMMIGGAYMLTHLQNRDFTEDIDIFPLNFQITSSTSKVTKTVQKAIRAVAKRYGLRKDWMNDVAASMLGGLGPEPELELWMTSGKLRVYVPSSEYILAMKLFADREKDGDDIEALCQQLRVETRDQAQAILDRYVYQRWQIEYNVRRTLEKRFP
ncbi:MAG: hypothetical protein IMW89_16325 [Ktedonobacteraceae bacterium]|nr:hypothetical protein [Ktedonobacteraceae bacterium]